MNLMCFPRHIILYCRYTSEKINKLNYNFILFTRVGTYYMKLKMYRYTQFLTI